MVRLVVALAVAVVVVGCARSGGDDASDIEVTQPSDIAGKPDVVAMLPEDRDEPASALVIEDVVVGDGEVAAGEGDVLTVHYVGVEWTSGAQFDASWDRGAPFQFELGAGRVIAGWDIGLDGVREGGRRLLIIPPDMAYGDRGSGDRIAPGATLVFVVDVVSVDPGSDPPRAFAPERQMAGRSAEPIA
ncbi:MAG: FKBP-type peptidyl-prolyl cis-trans isomerase [Nitriliruptoraceae bacterium]